MAPALRQSTLGVHREALEVAAAAGSSSFGFELPVARHPGRGDVPLDLKLRYNSRVWQRMSGVQTKMVFNIDADWPAPGWRFNLPRLISHGLRNTILVGEDGTRHPYNMVAEVEATGMVTVRSRTMDGSFTDYSHVEDQAERRLLRGAAQFPDGRLIDFGAPARDHLSLYPTMVSDRNGNCVTISYVGGVGPAIDSITDSCGRLLRFHYDPHVGLSAITGPGLGGARREILRLHYATAVELRTNFGADAYVQRPDYVTLLDGLLSPGTGSGYWMQAPGDYSSYGMLRRVRECRGMTLVSSSLTDQGTMDVGRWSALTEYDYPATPSGLLTDAPTFSTSTHSWERVFGELAATEVTHYAVQPLPGGHNSTIVHPDGHSTMVELRRPGEGTQDRFVVRDSGGTDLQNSVTEWELGDGSVPRVARVSSVDGRGSKSVTRFGYGQGANRLRDVYHHAIDSDFVVKRTHVEYVDDLPYGIGGAHLPYLPRRVQTFDDGGDHCVSCTEFEYDGAQLRPTPGATGRRPGHGLYRGNPTLIRRYAAASEHAAPVEEHLRYDHCGNLISSQSQGHRQTSSVFEVETQYCSPSVVTTGSPDTASPDRMSRSFQYNEVGLPELVTEANGSSCTIGYDVGGLRPDSVVGPTGVAVTVRYDDVNMSRETRIHDGEVPSRLCWFGAVAFDGRGHIASTKKVIGAERRMALVEHHCDGEGRLVRRSAAFSPGDEPSWATFAYDGLGRLTRQTTPDGGTTRHFYDEVPIPSDIDGPTGSTVRSVDPAGRQRWVSFDSLGRVSGTVSPDPDGDGSFHSGDRLQVAYAYDGNDNLVLARTHRGGDMFPEEQWRGFQYDSLSRLTHLRLPERGNRLLRDGTPGSADPSNWSEIYTYDDHSNLTSRTDSRGIVTRWHYDDDPLDRVHRVSFDTSGWVDHDYPVVPIADWTFAYEPAGDLTRIRTESTAGACTQQHTYDRLDRLASTSVSMEGLPGYPFEIGYRHDTLGRIDQITYPAEYGRGGARPLVEHHHEAGDVPALVACNGVPVASQFTFNGAGQITSLLTGPPGPTQCREEYWYDDWHGWLLHQTLTRAGVPLLDQSYDYEHLDITGTPRRTPQISRLVDHLNDARSVSYDYDALGRLTDAIGGIGTQVWEQHYTYDPYGNRTHVTSAGTTGPPDFFPIPPDGLPHTTPDPTTNRTDGPAGLGRCDAAGNQTLRTNPRTGEQMFCQYDAAGRLAVVTDDTGRSLKRYTYGTSNRRLATEEADGSMAYDVWSGNLRIASLWDLQPNQGHDVHAVSIFLYLQERVLAARYPKSGGAPIILYTHPDRRGTRFVTNDRDALSGTDNHVLPYGAVATEDHTAPFDLALTTYVRDVGTELDDAVNRVYDPGTARFLQPDPIGLAGFDLINPQSLNSYAYCVGDPVSRTDRLGLVYEQFVHGYRDGSYAAGPSAGPDPASREDRAVAEDRDPRPGGGGGGGKDLDALDKKTPITDSEGLADTLTAVNILAHEWTAAAAVLGLAAVWAGPLPPVAAALGVAAGVAGLGAIVLSTIGVAGSNTLPDRR